MGSTELLSRLWPALLLGVVQGLTEFLPVSSSGHLVVGSHVLPLSQPSLLFDVILHVGTLLPVLWLYRADLWQMLRALGRVPGGGLRRRWDDDRGLRLAVCVVVGTIPTALMGALLKDLFERLFATPVIVGGTFVVTGGILMLSLLRRGAPPGGDEPDDSHRGLTLARALAVGVTQGCAITPGISRSGTTITACLLLGIERTMAARFSFLLSIPAILGAVVLQLRQVQGGDAATLLIHVAGALAAAASGYLALRWLVRTVRRGAMHWFALYLWPLGIVVLVYWLLIV